MSATDCERRVDLHQSGRLREAETAYRDVLVGHLNNPDALHLLGLVTHQAGRLDEAVELIEKAISRAPDAARYHNNLALALDDLGRLDDAEPSAPSYTASNVQVRRKLNWNSIDRWRLYEKHLGALIEALGTTADHDA